MRKRTERLSNYRFTNRRKMTKFHDKFDESCGPLSFYEYALDHQIVPIHQRIDPDNQRSFTNYSHTLIENTSNGYDEVIHMDTVFLSINKAFALEEENSDFKHLILMKDKHGLSKSNEVRRRNDDPIWVMSYRGFSHLGVLPLSRIIPSDESFHYEFQRHTYHAVQGMINRRRKNRCLYMKYKNISRRG